MPRVSTYRLRRVAQVYAREPAARTPFADLIEMAGAAPEALDQPDGTFELLHEAGLVERACRELGDKTFAARVGLSAQGPGTLVAYLVSASTTLQEALMLAQRYYAMQDADVRIGLVGSADGPRLTLSSNVIPTHQYPRHREMLLFGLYRRLRQIAGDGLWPISLELDTDDLKHCQRLSELAGCAVAGNCDSYAVQLPPGAMQFPIPTADAALLGHLRQHGETQLRARPVAEKSLSERVTDFLEDRLPGRMPNGDTVADALGMTRRTMTRRLATEGTSFKALLEGTQCDLAKRLLRSGESIAQIAFALDFADQAAFSVAFKRWTGETPARYRRSKL
ncbi:helix-turn-helix domain-containing protein [Tropicimonas sp. TH_r6]|uniref:helix-turn-helix domain-containing protein n=1 Tax=Tropicimonas sp. TH_r6 TaxID=3082085 RepID=UPI002954CEA9|nr:helix-turn-helix domain-containing protein [Tropicimonas sp. TH_r6]MDV7143713.1 helix-turn-helix domain-containing protein [Tropicimonas sp. TH_r6]